MKYTLKNRPKKHGFVSRNGRWEEYSEVEIDEWFEGFEAELRERLEDYRNGKDILTTGFLKEILGE